MLCLFGAVMMAVAIFVFTHIPNEKVPRLVTQIGNDKVRHVLSYGLFAGLLLVGLGSRMQSRFAACLWVLGITAVFAGIDEITQPLARRTCSLADFAASMGGALVGIGAGLLVSKLGKSRKQKVES